MKPPTQASTCSHSPRRPASSPSCGIRIDHAVRIRRRGAHEHHRIRPACRRHRRDIGAEIRVDGNPDHAQTHEMRRLVECRMRGLRRDDGGPRNLRAFGPGAISCCLHREEDALSAAGRHRAARIRPGMQQPQRHANDICFEARQAGKCLWTKAVFGKELEIGLLGDRQHVLARIVDVDADAAVPPIHIIQSRGFHSFVEHFRADAQARQFGHGSESPQAASSRAATVVMALRRMSTIATISAGSTM